MSFKKRYYISFAEHIIIFVYNNVVFAKFGYRQADFYSFSVVNPSYHLYNCRRGYNKAKTSFELCSAELKPAPLASSMHQLRRKHL